MGRPRKKQKTSEDNEQDRILPTEVEIVAKKRRFAHIMDPQDTGAFEALCPGPVTQYINNYTPPPRQPFMTSGALYENRSESLASETTPPSNAPTTPLSNIIPEPIYPTDVDLWPDYSTMLSLPMVVQAAHEEAHASEDHSDFHSLTSFDFPNTLPSIPACPCLPNLYLTLSTLNTLSSFPVSSDTIQTLQTGARTAYSVLYCAVCPQRFQSGMQNVMLLGTLLAILADGWHRVRKALPEDLRNGFSPAHDADILSLPLNALQSLEWRTFAHRLTRAYVFGDQAPPTPPGTRCPPSPIPDPSTCLLALIEGMKRRQSQWHHPETSTGEFAERLKHTEHDGHLQGMSLAEIEAVDIKEEGYLCLKIVERAGSVIKALDREAPTY
jgi:hypothetical protein